MNFKQWLLREVGTMSSGVTGGIGDIAQFKMPIGIGIVRRTWPNIEKKSKKKLKISSEFGKETRSL